MHTKHFKPLVASWGNALMNGFIFCLLASMCKRRTVSFQLFYTVLLINSIKQYNKGGWGVWSPWSWNTIEPAPEWDPDNPDPGEVICLIVTVVRNKTIDAIWIQVFFFQPKNRQKKHYLETKMYSYRGMFLFQMMLYRNNIFKKFFLTL